MSDKPDYSLLKYAKVDQPPKESKSVIYYGIFRGVNFEIKNMKEAMNDFEEQWTYYIYINIDDQLSDEFKEKFWLPPRYHKFSEHGTEHCAYDYYATVVGNLDFHGGCTWYSKETNVDEKSRRVKIGCDYQHLWDVGNSYSVESVHRDVKRTIDSLYEIVGDVKIWSWGDGKYRFLNEYKNE